MRPLTEREKKILQFEQLKKELETEPELYKEDFKLLLIEYKDSLIDQEASKNTRLQYNRNAKWFVDNYTSNKKPLTKEDVMRMKEQLLDKGYQPKTISNRITTVNRFLYFCEQSSKAVKNIVIQDENTVKHRLYDHEYKRMINRAKHNKNMNLHFIMKIMGSTGVRFDELKYFTDKSIQGTTITITNKGTTKIIPIPQRLRYELREYVKENNIVGKVVDGSNSNINKQLKVVAGEVKVLKEKISAHQFRHYFAFKFLEINGEGGLIKLKNIMGHKSVETTEKYLKGTTADYEEAMNKM